MREIWTNELLPKALKSCPKSNKSPNLVTLLMFRQCSTQQNEENAKKRSIISEAFLIIMLFRQSDVTSFRCPEAIICGQAN